MPLNRTVSILGCGWYGFSLAKVLLQEGYGVKGSTTSAAKLPLLNEAGIDPYLLNFEPDVETNDPEFFRCGVLFVCFPPKVRSGNAADYLIRVDQLIKAIVINHVKQVIFISSTGVYGEVNGTVSELNEPAPDSESGKALLRAETLLRQQKAFTTTIIRFTGLIGPGRDPARFFAGKKAIPNGLAPVNLIHLTDCLGISLALLHKEAFGHTYNACAPSHPTKAEFYTKAARRSNLELPEFINEQNDWKIVESVSTPALLNYSFMISDLMGWLEE